MTVASDVTAVATKAAHFREDFHVLRKEPVHLGAVSPWLIGMPP